MKKFNEKIQNIFAKYNLLITKVYQNSCYQVSEDIAEGSPVSTGTLLGQWSPGNNSINSYSFGGGQSAWDANFVNKDEGIAAINKGAALSDLLPRIDSVTNSLSKKDTYYFTNDTEYIKQAEYDGWDKTDAYHMRENAILNWQLIVNNKAMELIS